MTALEVVPTLATGTDEDAAALVSRLHNAVARRLSTGRRAGMSAVAQEALVSDAVHEAIDVVNRERLADGDPLLTDEERARLVSAVIALVAGAGLLEDYLADDSIENIDANGPHEVFVTRAGGRRERGRPLAVDRQAFNAALKSLAMRGNELGEHRLDKASPILQMSLDGHRVTVVLGGTGEDGVGQETYLSIRRHRRDVKRLFLDDFVGLGTLTQQAADFLSAATRAALTTIIAGPADAGKTTLARALIHTIPPSERLVTIETVPELDLGSFPESHPNVVALYTRAPNAEGAGGIAVGELVRTALRLNPSRIFMGELLPGEDVVSWYNALSSGHDGSISTLHAPSSDKVFTRLVAYAAQSPDSPLDPKGSIPLVASAIDLIVYITKRGDQRYVSSVRMVGGEADGRILSDELFGMVDGQLTAKAGISQADIALRLADHGYVHRVTR